MRPEDIRKLYAEESEARPEEARETAANARTDPDTARRLLLTLYALAGEDPTFEQLLQLVLKVGTMQLLILEAERSDRFALHMAELILDGMETMKPGSGVGKTPRGRQSTKKASTA